jgi:bifunctional DNA-binding transcriptional regulator/antitoxin component of YhaV-PrlF toxin-antitoxin module
MTQTPPEPYYGKVDSRGRIVIRKAHREFMGLPDGGAVEWYLNKDGKVTLGAAKKDEND